MEDDGIISRAAFSGGAMTIEAEPGSTVMEAALALLQSGVGVACRPGSSAREFMREALGLADDYIEGVVSTVFIDSEPVDDIDAAKVADGSVVALSAAMPGLVGAILRRNSPYASLRKAISYDNLHAGLSGDVLSGDGPAGEGGIDGENQASAPQAVVVRLKLFNQVMRDLGEGLLASGILVSRQEALGFAALAGLAPAAMSASPEGSAPPDGFALRSGGTVPLRIIVSDRGLA